MKRPQQPSAADEEYSSLEVVMQLSPRVRESMLQSPKYQRYFKSMRMDAGSG